MKNIINTYVGKTFGTRIALSVGSYPGAACHNQYLLLKCNLCGRQTKATLQRLNGSILKGSKCNCERKKSLIPMADRAFYYSWLRYGRKAMSYTQFKDKHFTAWKAIHAVSNVIWVKGEPKHLRRTVKVLGREYTATQGAVILGMSHQAVYWIIKKKGLAVYTKRLTDAIKKQKI